MKGYRWSRSLGLLAIAATVGMTSVPAFAASDGAAQVLEWNQIFIESLVATNTAPSVSPRVGAIVHTAIFDAYNGIERRYTPIFVQTSAPRGASRRAAVIAAAYTTLLSLFPSRQGDLDASYAASLAALSEDDDEDGGRSRERGIAWGVQVAQAVLAWRAADGFTGTYPAFRGGTAVGQWRPTPPLMGAMSSQPLAFTAPFVLPSTILFQPPPPRGLLTQTYTDDFNAVKVLGKATGSTRTDDQTWLAPFWDGNASVHWNQAANQMARANNLSMSKTVRLLTLLNVAMADTMSSTWNAKRHYGGIDTDVTWRPVTAIVLADTDGNPNTVADPGWTPLITTPSHPEYPSGHPSLNGAAATVLLSCFSDEQTFTLTTKTATDLLSRTYMSISQARSDGNNARVWGGMHYPSTVAVGDQLGENVAKYVNEHAMQPLHGDQ
jgi:membrane-associated phospholipid phosphatase